MSTRQLRGLFPHEVIVAASSSSATTQRGGLYVLDPSSSASAHTPLMHFKGAAHAAPHGLSCTVSSTHACHDGGTSGCIAVIESDKAVLSLYSWQRDQPITRIVLPQKMSCVALSPRAIYLATGTADGRLYVWHVRSGALLCSFEAHYRGITAIQWTLDSAAIITASQDTRACVWSWPSIMQYTDLTHTGGPAPAPYATLSDHTLDISDMYVTAGAFPHETRLWTASLDGSVKSWDLASRRLVSTYVLDEPVRVLAVDPLERFFFVALHERVCRIDLYANENMSGSGSSAGSVLRFRGGRGASGVSERVSDAPHIELNTPISALALSLQSSHIVIGTHLGHVHVVDGMTLQTVRTLAAHASSMSQSAGVKTPVTSLFVVPRPVDLSSLLDLRAPSGAKRSQHSNDRDAASSAYMDPLPVPTVPTQFARTLSSPLDQPHVYVRVGDTHSSHVRNVHRLFTWARQNQAAQPATSLPLDPKAPERVAHVAADSSTETPALMQRIRTLEAQAHRAKALNDQMWQHLVQVEAHSAT